MDALHDRLSERTRLAMDRTVAFWRREMSDQILVSFSGPGARRSGQIQHVSDDSQVVCSGCLPLFEDTPKMLQDLESSIEPGRPAEETWDDSPGIWETMPELQFGNGIMGAIFGGKLHVVSSKVLTMTFNDPVVTHWDQVDGLRFDENNEWVQRIVSCLTYFVQHASKPFAIRQFVVYEGANFVVSMRGTTQAFFDLADKSPALRQLYELGYTSGVRFFELKREVIREHNEKVLQHPEFASLAPLHNMPWLDTDAYALCSRRVFEEIGFEFKQKILDHFGGGQLYIHGLGRHIIPAAGRLNHLTELSLYDDPKCDPYFDHRSEVRSQTYDIPLSMACDLRELVQGLEERSLPGGVAYDVYIPTGVSSMELNHLMDLVRAYRAGRLLARPR